MKKPPEFETALQQLPGDNQNSMRIASRIAIVLTLAYLSATGLYAFAARQSDAWQLLALTGLMVVLLVSSIAGFWLARRGRVAIGVLVMLITLNIVFPAAMLFEAGLGLTLGISALLGTFLIARLTLRQKHETVALAIGVASAVLTILLDYFLPIERPTFPSIVTYMPLVAGAAIATFIYFIAREFANYPLRTKLILMFIMVALIPLASLSLYANITSRNQIYETSTSDLREVADTTALQVDTFIRNQLVSIFVESQNPLFNQYMALAPEQRAGSHEEASALEGLSTLARKDTVFIRSYALIDLTGTNILDTNQDNSGRDESRFGYHAITLERQQSSMTGPVFDQQDGQASLYFSSPVRNQSGDIIGILRLEYNAGIIQSIVNNLLSQSETNTGRLLAVVDEDTYVRVAYTGDREKLYKSFNSFTAKEVAILQIQGRLLPGLASDALAPSPEIVVGLQNLSQKPFFTAPSSSLGGDAITTGRSLENAPWIVVARQSEAILFSPIERQTRTIILISMGLVGLAAAAALLLARILASPVIRLTSVAEKVSTGNLSARAAVESSDEIGAMAEAFNRMTGRLQEILEGLERRVAERTADLDAALLLSERRAQELQSISEISRLISTEQKLEILLPLITRLVSERFDFYHVGIFFVDETRRFAYLQAANSEGGQRMLVRSHRLEIGTGLVGTVARTAKPRIALDVGADAAFFDNPDLPNTRSEMALPLNIRGQTIGVLDIQSTNSGAFTEKDANTLGILADQVAIAIENARLFGQMQQSREEAEALYSQIQRQEWSAFASQETRLGYRQTATGGRRLVKPVETDEIRHALENGQVVVLDGRKSSAHPSLAVPVKLRGHTIGVLNVKAPTKDRNWNQDEINLAQAVSDRLALALDNARLLQESQRRAAKEAKIGEVSARIGASINLKNVLQTAVEELGRALPGSEVLIQFEQSE